MDKQARIYLFDDRLMADALSASGLKTKKEFVEEGLKALIRLRNG